MDKEEFYRSLDELFEVTTYREPPKYYRRWGQRNLGNGRYEGRGLVRWFGPSTIQVHLTDPVLRGSYTDGEEALSAIRKAMTMTKHYVLKFDRDWADEFSVYGFEIITEQQKEDLHDLVAEHGDIVGSFSFGTNEFWEDKISDLFKSFEFVEITLDQKEALEAVFPELKSEYSFMRQFGYVPDIVEYLIENEIIDEDPE